MDDKRAWAEIDLGALRDNIGLIRGWIGDDVKLMAVVKADGYGHGALGIAQAAMKSGVDWFGVAVIEEALALRERGIDAPVLVLGKTPSRALKDAVHLGLSQTVFDYESAIALSNAAVAYGKSLHIHIKVDTGMHRLGFMPCAASLNEIEGINALPGLVIEGIFTHLAAADGLEPDFTEEQAGRFDAFIKELAMRGVHAGLRHAANSAGTLAGRRFFYDMVRTGCIMYGLKPSPGTDTRGLALRPVLSLRSRVAQIRCIEPGDSVGYGRMFFADRKTLVATIPVGYADGYSRLLSNKAYVLAHGRRVPVIGAVCMDYFMVDVTDLGGRVKIGDAITLIGQDGGEEISTDEIAGLMGMINYEVVCGIGNRIRRVYM